MSYDFQNKIALVTGASRGLGYALALDLAKRGCHVIAMARTVGGLEELDDAIKNIGGQSTLMPFDLKKTDELLSLGPLLADRFKRLDIVIGNAGLLGPMTPIAQIKPKQWDEVMTVNVTANHRLLATLDPLLRGSQSGRALFVTSRAAETIKEYRAVYAVSKAALNQMVKTYALENNQGPLKTALLDPGLVRTKMRAQVAPGENPKTLPTPQQVASNLLNQIEQDLFENGQIIHARV